jgi:hypothetical protein
MLEVIRSSEPSFRIGAARHNISEDGIFYSQDRDRETGRGSEETSNVINEEYFRDIHLYILLSGNLKRWLR